MSGPEACRRLTDAHPEVPVLVVSTYSDDELVDACIAAGAKGYVIKDIERFTLKQSIRAVDSGQVQPRRRLPPEFSSGFGTGARSVQPSAVERETAHSGKAGE